MTTAAYRTPAIHVTRWLDRDGNTWTLTANPKPWRGMGGIDLTEAELAERGPLTDTSYDIPPTVKCANCQHQTSQHTSAGCWGPPNGPICLCRATEFTVTDKEGSRG